jgi:glycosyltransferase involved in cell wall biosynthesis
MEEYISKCIRSCLKQDIDINTYEIIIINDGSTDNSSNEIAKIASENHNIILINKSNGGVGSARNSGLIKAKGKYIWFIDADDYIEECSLQNIVSTLEADKLDALQLCFYYKYNYVVEPCNKRYRITTDVLTPDEFMNPNLFIGGIWSTVIKREKIIKNNIKFEESLSIGEDQIFLMTVLHYSQRIKRIKNIVYYYNYNPQSAMHQVTEYQLQESIRKILEFPHRSQFEDYCNYLIMHTIIIYLNIKVDNIKELYRITKRCNINYMMIIKYFNGYSKLIVQSLSISPFITISFYYHIRSLYRSIFKR